MTVCTISVDYIMALNNTRPSARTWVCVRVCVCVSVWRSGKGGIPRLELDKEAGETEVSICTFYPFLHYKSLSMLD